MKNRAYRNLMLGGTAIFLVAPPASAQVLASVATAAATSTAADPSPTAPDQAGGGSQLEEIVWREQIEAAVPQLSEREQRICKLYLQDRSCEEIGAALDLSADAARKAHRRAEMRIRTQFLAGQETSEA